MHVINKIKQKLNNSVIPYNFRSIEINDEQMNEVMTDINMDGIKPDEISIEGSSNPSKAEMEEIILAADASSVILAWNGSGYDSMHLSISDRAQLSPDTEMSLPEDI